MSAVTSINNNLKEKGRTLQKFLNGLFDYLYNKWRKRTPERARGQATRNVC